MVLDGPLAEELGQETFVRAYAARQRYDRSLAVHPWLHAIAVNLVRSHLRRARLLRFFPLLDSLADDRSGVGRHDLDLTNALRRLSPGDRSALVLHYVHGFDYSEVGKILNVPAGTVASRINRSRSRLRRLLEPDYPALPLTTRLRRRHENAPTG